MKCNKIVLVFFLFIINHSFSQTGNDNKLKFHSIAMGFGGFNVKNAYSEDGGVSFTTDIVLAVNKNLISTSYITGSEVGLLGGSTFSFNDLSLSYGRALKVTNWFYLEGYLGLGRYTQERSRYLVNYGSTVSFPIKINTKFYFNKKFGMGLNTSYITNKINNNLSVNLIFHYKYE